MQRVARLPGGHLWLLLLVLACGGPARAPGSRSADRREATAVPLKVSEAVRSEMRTMLGSLHRILTASVAGDTAAMRAAATRSGLATAADPALEKLLPEGFVQLGIATHRQFDDLAVAIAAGAPRDSTDARLARLTGHCVSCHESYRLEVR